MAITFFHFSSLWMMTSFPGRSLLSANYSTSFSKGQRSLDVRYLKLILGFGDDPLCREMKHPHLIRQTVIRYSSTACWLSGKVIAHFCHRRLWLCVNRYNFFFSPLIDNFKSFIQHLTKYILQFHR